MAHHSKRRSTQQSMPKAIHGAHTWIMVGPRGIVRRAARDILSNRYTRRVLVCNTPGWTRVRSKKACSTITSAADPKVVLSSPLPCWAMSGALGALVGGGRGADVAGILMRSNRAIRMDARRRNAAPESGRDTFLMRFKFLELS